jgi:hypothetical protein
MHLLAPDILETARELPLAISATVVGLGFLLWLTGWWWHRFWIVLATTVAGGITGLNIGPTYGLKPLVAGLLLAIAGGQLALALVRVVIFAAVGLITSMLVHTQAPGNWDVPLGSFLAGGLVGLLLFRWWTMVLTSFTGAMLMGYALLCVLDRLQKLNALQWAERNMLGFDGGCLGVAALGVLVQFLLERRRIRKQRWQEEQQRLIKEVEREQEIMQQVEPRRRGWLGWGKDYRQAG